MAGAEVDRHRIAEAAIWVARLQSDARAPGLEADLRAWLAASDANRAAFAAATESWDLAGALRPAPSASLPASPPSATALRPVSRRAGPYALALAASLVAAVGLGAWYIRQPVPIETSVGERRVLALADGSSVTLNTDTRLHTRFSPDKRLVVLDHGEASFDVAHDTLRPFVVQAGQTRIVAVGTVFDVRWTGGRLAVTLAQGKVRVIDASRRATAASPAPEVELLPGQRFEQVVPAAAGIAPPPPRLASVDLATARAWRSGHVVFADVPLAQAVEELNRYSDRPLRIAGPATGALRISGAFRAGDSPQFARAVAQLYGLHLEDRDGTLILEKPD